MILAYNHCCLFIIIADIGRTLELLVYNDNLPLLAAYTIYVESRFSRLGWLEFWDTVKHLIRRYHPAHALDSVATQYALGSQSAHLGRCIDALYGGQDERILSATGYRYLKDLLATHDVVLESAWFHYRDTGDLEELKDTLLHLSERWTRYAHAHHYLLLFGSFTKEMNSLLLCSMYIAVHLMVMYCVIYKHCLMKVLSALLSLIS
jgi:hypothetical protein